MNLNQNNFKFGIILFEKNICIQKNFSDNQIKVSSIDLDDIKNKNNYIWFTDLNKIDLWRMGFDDNVKYNNFFNTPIQNIINNIKEKDENVMALSYKLYFIINNIMKECFKVFSSLPLLEHSNLYLSIKYRNYIKPLKIRDDFINQVIFNSYYEPVYCISENEKDNLLKNGYKLETIKSNGLLFFKDLINENSIYYYNFENNNIKYELKNNKELLTDLNKYNSYNKENLSLIDYLNSIGVDNYLIYINYNNKKLKEKYIDKIHYHEIFNIQNRKNNRSWINNIELKYILNFFDFDNNFIEKAIFIEKNNNYINQDLLKLKNLKFENIYYFSIVMTILFENYILSLIEKDVYYFCASITNNILSSKEKKNLLLLSIILKENGYIIYYYGNNTIMVLRKEEQSIEDLKKICEKYNFFIF